MTWVVSFVKFYFSQSYTVIIIFSDKSTWMTEIVKNEVKFYFMAKKNKTKQINEYSLQMIHWKEPAFHGTEERRIILRIDVKSSNFSHLCVCVCVHNITLAKCNICKKKIYPSHTSCTQYIARECPWKNKTTTTTTSTFMKNVMTRI